MDMPAYVLIISLAFALLSIIAVRVFGISGRHVFGASFPVFFIVLFFALFPFFNNDEITRINKTGELRLATIMNATQTNTWVNGNPQVLLELKVHEIDGSSYPATLKAVMGLLYLSEIRPARKIEVVRDRENHEKVVLKAPDFEQLQEAYRLEIEKNNENH